MNNCLVTGGAGFIGSHLAEALLAQGRRVTVLDDASTGRWSNLAAAAAHPRLRMVTGDAGDPAVVRPLVAEADEVYHLAAAVGVALIARDPIQTIERNVAPTQLLLEEAQRRAAAGGPMKFFLASTSEVYGKNPLPVWKEDDDLVFGATTRPRWSYGVSKAIDEFLALAFWRRHRLPLVIGRFFNVAGPRQTGAYGMVLPRFVDAALAGEPLRVHDDGQQTRCFAHVADVVDAVLRLMETPAALGRVFNIGADEPVSILELAEMVRRLVNPHAPLAFQSYAEAYDHDFEDIRRRVPDLTRLRETIGRHARRGLEDIVREVAAWRRGG